MLVTIGYTVSMLLYVGIMVYRILAKSFSRYLREESGFVLIFLILSLAVQVPIILKACYIFAVVLTFIFGYIRKGHHSTR